MDCNKDRKQIRLIIPPPPPPLPPHLQLTILLLLRSNNILLHSPPVPTPPHQLTYGSMGMPNTSPTNAIVLTTPRRTNSI